MKSLLSFFACNNGNHRTKFFLSSISKKTYKLVVLCILLVSVSLVACKADSDDEKDKTYRLEGTWVSCPGCLVLEQYITKVTMVFSEKDKTYTQLISMNNPENITLGWYELKSVGTYITGDKIEIANLYGSMYPMQIDLIVDSVTVTPTSEWGVAFMNDANNLFMGQNDWALNVTKDVTGLASETTKGVVTYDIFWIDVESDILRFGDVTSGDKTSAATRPTLLASEAYIKIEKK